MDQPSQLMFDHFSLLGQPEHLQDVAARPNPDLPGVKYIRADLRVSIKRLYHHQQQLMSRGACVTGGSRVPSLSKLIVPADSARACSRCMH
jgi:hypothetical protein